MIIKTKKWPKLMLRGIAICCLVAMLLWLVVGLWARAQIHRIFEDMQSRSSTRASVPVAQ